MTLLFVVHAALSADSPTATHAAKLSAKVTAAEEADLRGGDLLRLP